MRWLGCWGVESCGCVEAVDFFSKFRSLPYNDSKNARDDSKSPYQGRIRQNMHALCMVVLSKMMFLKCFGMFKGDLWGR